MGKKTYIRSTSLNKRKKLKMKLKIEEISENFKINVMSEKFAHQLDMQYFSFRDQFFIPLKKDLPKSNLLK